MLINMMTNLNDGEHVITSLTDMTNDRDSSLEAILGRRGEKYVRAPDMISGISGVAGKRLLAVFKWSG